MSSSLSYLDIWWELEEVISALCDDIRPTRLGYSLVIKVVNSFNMISVLSTVETTFDNDGTLVYILNDATLIYPLIQRINTKDDSTHPKSPWIPFPKSSSL